MTRYIVKLTEQEELNLRQLTTQPGFEPLLKLVQGESLAAQTEAMECKSLVAEERSHALMKAQVAVEVVSNLTKKLCSFQQIPMPPQDENAEPDPLDFSMFNGRKPS